MEIRIQVPVPWMKDSNLIEDSGSYSLYEYYIIIIDIQHDIVMLNNLGE